MKTLKIDEKWSVQYDPANNDRPVQMLRYGEPCFATAEVWSNDRVAMFYALLESRMHGEGPEKPDFAALCVEIHAANVRAGWWTDIKTNDSILHTRNRPEMLMLAVSELAEAFEGSAGTMDDKLPHLPMYDVELADFVIRQFDQIGAEVSCGVEMPDWAPLPEGLKEAELSALRCGSRNYRLMTIVAQVAMAMEHYRKGRVDSYVRVMAEGIRIAFAVAQVEGIPLLDIMRQKMAFNASREDHKIENRTKAGGKRF